MEHNILQYNKKFNKYLKKPTAGSTSDKNAQQ